MNKADLVAGVQAIVPDTSWSSSAILPILNRGVKEIAGGGPRNWGQPLLPPLPDLLSSGTVATDANHNVALPATYHRGLFRVYDSSGNKIAIADSFIKFSDKYDGLTKNGSVEQVCVRGGVLYYQGVPAASQTITLWFHRLPVDMSADASTPDGIPEHLQHRLLVNFACREIFSVIEGGAREQKSNMLHHDNEYQLALTDLRRFLGAGDKEPQYIEDTSDYISDY